MLNSVGLQNPGVEAWLATDLPALAATGARVVVSVWGRSVGDYADVGACLASALAARPHPVVAVEANVSCPNVEDRDRIFAHSAETTSAVVGALAGAVAPADLPVWAKLSPNVTDLVAIAGAALGAGAGGLTLVNTLMGLALDPATGQPMLGGGGGGLSGPALHPVAVRAVFECRRAFPAAAIVGVGGVSSGYDAAELLSAGADAVQVGTASFVDPKAPVRVLAELADWCASHGFESVAQLVGTAHRGTAPGGRRLGRADRPRGRILRAAERGLSAGASSAIGTSPVLALTGAGSGRGGRRRLPLAAYPRRLPAGGRRPSV